MSPPATALRIPIVPDADEQESGSVQLASEWELEVETKRRERRVHSRHRAPELEWLRSARLAGQAVSIVDLSVGGALLDSPVALRPDALLTLDITGRGFDKSIPFRVVRCQIGALLPERTVYRGACEFTQLDRAAVRAVGGAKVLYPDAFVNLDIALKQLVERTGSTGMFGSLDTGTVRDALESLRDRAIKAPLDPMGHPLAALIGQVSRR